MSDPDDPRDPEAALRRADAEDVARLLAERERAARRHTLWALLGVSPAGLIPMIGAVSEFGVPVLVAGMTAIAATETLRAVRARGEAQALRERLHALTTEWTPSRLESPDG